MERYQEEIVVRRSRVAWLEKVKAGKLADQNLWRTGLESLPIWKMKGNKHAAKRKGSKLTLESTSKKSKKCKLHELESPQQRVRLISESGECDKSRNIICISEEEKEECVESGSGRTPADPEFNSTVAVGSPINPGMELEAASCDATAFK